MAVKIELMEKEYTIKDAVTTPEGMYCRDLYHEYQNSSYRQKKLKDINEGRKRYRNERPAKNFPWPGSSNKSMGLEGIAVDQLEPRIANRLIGEDDFVQVDPTGPEDVENAEKTKEFMHWATLNNMKIKKQIKPIVHDLLKDGTKDVICLWEEKEFISRVRGTNPVFRNADGERVEIPTGLFAGADEAEIAQRMQQLMSIGVMPAGDEEGYREKKDTKFKVLMEGLKLEDCYFPDHNDHWEEQPFLRMIYPTLRELKDGSENGGPYKNISNDLVDGYQRPTTQDEDAKKVSYSLYEQQCTLLECYYRWEGEWKLATLSPNAAWTEVRNQKMIDVYWHGRKPVRRFTIYPESNESMGTGIPKKIEHFSKGINDCFNMMIDNGTIEVMPYGFYNKSATGMEQVQTKLFPGALVPIPKDSQVYWPQAGVKSPVFIEFINLLLTFFERTLSLMDYSAGTRSATTGQGGDTASGMNMIMQEGNIKHNYTGDHLQDTFAEVLTDVLSLYIQYMPMDAQIRINEGSGYTFKDVDIQAIQGAYDLLVQVSDASANTMTNRNEKLTLKQVFANSPDIDQGALDGDVLKAFGMKQTDKYVKPGFAMVTQALQTDPEGVQQAIQEHMQQFMQQQEEQKIRGQAEDNIQRQAIEREVEAPHENQKIVDQANEGFKRKMTGQIIEHLGGLPG